MTNFANHPPNPQGPSPRPEQHVICTRCNVPKRYMGTRLLEAQTPWDSIFSLWAVTGVQPKFDLYACPTCGSVEFFLDGVGEHLRPQ